MCLPDKYLPYYPSTEYQVLLPIWLFVGVKNSRQSRTWKFQKRDICLFQAGLSNPLVHYSKADPRPMISSYRKP